MAKRKPATAVREGSPQPVPPRNEPGDRGRGGETVLRTRVQRAILIAALIAAVLLALLLQVAQ
jgi:hypothetical protein